MSQSTLKGSTVVFAIMVIVAAAVAATLFFSDLRKSMLAPTTAPAESPSKGAGQP